MPALARKPAKVKNDYQRVEGHQITTERRIAQILIATKNKRSAAFLPMQRSSQRRKLRWKTTDEISLPDTPTTV
jgi:hypothetical protein